MKLELYQEVALTRDIPDENLRAGDVATLVDTVPHPSAHLSDGEEGAILEVFNLRKNEGDSLAVVTVPISAIAPLRADQVPAVRLLHAG